MLEGDKLWALPGECAAENELAEIKRRCLGAEVSEVFDFLAGDGDASAFGVGLLSFDVANDL